jgi:hypothetical protein
MREILGTKVWLEGGIFKISSPIPQNGRISELINLQIC